MSFGLIKTIATQCGERIFGVHPPARKTRGDGSGQTGVLCARGLENIPLKKKKKKAEIRAAEGKRFKLASEINEGCRQ